MTGKKTMIPQINKNNLFKETCRITKNYINIKFFLIILFFSICSSSVKSRSYENTTFICADEIGPRLKFLIPNFNDSFKKKFSLNLYSKKNRDDFYDIDAEILKKSSPIDETYYFYKVTLKPNNNKNLSGEFEFFPPSTLMFKETNYPYENFACWTEK